MKTFARPIALACLFFALYMALTACSRSPEAAPGATGDAEGGQDRSRVLVVVEEEPDTVDFQSTTIHYTIAANVFDRLVEMTSDAQGEVTVVPSLALSWEVSDDGRVYTFHLRPDVRFSNGEALTASDVLYTFTRLLTWPEGSNRDIAENIVGAQALQQGRADRLEGFEVLGELDFAITLEQPFEAFLACLSMPGASILDQTTTEAAGERFGQAPEWTVGTGPFILTAWERGSGMLMTANPTCWQGAPACVEVDMRFLTEPEELKMLYEQGGLDILDLDDAANYKEFFVHGDIYRDKLYKVPWIGITYIALNEKARPLDDARVRQALQLALDRAKLLKVVCSGWGSVENGIFPHGLYGFNPDLPEIPCDPDRARALLAEAGYPDGFELRAAVKSSATQWELTLMRLAASMWAKVGVRASIEVLDEDEFMRLRKAGELPCYSATWTADYDDPDNFIYTFFGTPENAKNRSLNYGDEAVMARVRAARLISDPQARLAEYRELERIIIQQDAAWIPLFSRLHIYALSDRVESIHASWNGSVKNTYGAIVLREAP